MNITINCFICGKKTNNNRIALSNRMIVCFQCFCKYKGFKCKYCNRIYLSQDYDKKNDCCVFCLDCIKKEKEYRKLKIHNYYFKPYPSFFRLKDQPQNNLFLGIQLEIGGIKKIEFVNKFAANNESSFFYIKKDATIPEYGCQIVSYPATLNYHMSDQSKWKKILYNARKYHFKSYNIENCGLHIHVNKNFFNKNQIKYLDLFVNSNEQLFKKISRRTSEYSRFLNKPADLYGKPINQNRYCALNLCNQNTIQFRMFKGTINYKSVISYIQFVHSLCFFVKQNKKQNITIQNYIDYINGKYKFLNNFLNKLKEG